ncbi:GNAT family N-acetyltransferase [Amycolatopsis sp. NPDC059027]|uniref:GNAT family N-acetyltransferase n=1 Tax=unclassified Amycolatopsis TaxID=2618356 RepID=UPI00366F8BAC
MISLRVLTAEDWAAWREMRLAALREAPEAFGASLADWQGAGDTELRWRQRLGGHSFNVLAALNGKPAGMASGMPRDDVVELISMWVAPFARGRGVGDALVVAVVEWAKEHGAERVVLRVQPSNQYAAALYRRHGFRVRGR